MSSLGSATIGQLGAEALRAPPGAEEIRAELERILASPDFQVPDRARSFLRYVVEETLAGRANRIKGYSIATEVFDRDDSFTQEDPVVRIEAGRMRRALERYYLLSGRQDAIRIDIPKGRYVPAFSWHGSDPEPSGGLEPAQPGSEVPRAAWVSRWTARQMTYGLLAAGLALLAIVITIAYLASGLAATDEPSLPRQAMNPGGPTLVVAAFSGLSGGPTDDDYATGLTQQVLGAVSRFKEITVLAHQTSKGLPSQAETSALRQTRYVLSGDVQVSGMQIRVTARLGDTQNSSILWSQTYDNDLRSRDFFAFESEVAAQIATAVAQPYGVIYETDSVNPELASLEAYRCTLKFYVYRAQLSARLHGQVRECLERTVARFSNHATAWSMLAITYLDEYRFGFNPRIGTSSPLDRSLNAARRAVDLDSHNVRAMQALMTALFLNRQLPEAIKLGEAAYAVNPNDTEFLGEFGARLALGGQWHRGEALLREAVAHNPGASGYYLTLLALCGYMQQDDAAALAAIGQSNHDALPLLHLVASEVYARNGMADDAARQATAFANLTIDPEPGTPGIASEDIIRTIAGLRTSGLLPVSVHASSAPTKP